MSRIRKFQIGRVPSYRLWPLLETPLGGSKSGNLWQEATFRLFSARELRFWSYLLANAGGRKTPKAIPQCPKIMRT